MQDRMFDPKQLADTAQGFIAEGGPIGKLMAGGVGVIGTALLDAYTSVAVVGLAILMVADVLIGVGRAKHEGEDFELDRALLALVKASCALIGIAVFVTLDAIVLGADPRVPEDLHLFYSAGITILVAAYGFSVLENLAHFWPPLRALSDRLRSMADTPSTRATAEEKEEDATP